LNYVILKTVSLWKCPTTALWAYSYCVLQRENRTIWRSDGQHRRIFDYGCHIHIQFNDKVLVESLKYSIPYSATGTSPSPRAAHAAACIETNQVVIYGGATGSGGLASDLLYLLEFRENLGVWTTIPTTGRTPGKRYGHIMCYAKPHLVVFGGNTADKSVNDCWVLHVNMDRPCSWVEITAEHEAPCPRVYHSAALCSAGSAANMIVVFGGRSADQSPLNDAWGLRRHRNGNWDWVKAPYKSKPRPRYQHTTLFMGSVMLVIGGRTNNVGESLPL
jgi:protein phosphatase